jgi:hypothetical protein
MKKMIPYLLIFSLVACRKHDVDPNQSETDCSKQKFVISGAKGDCYIYKSLNLTLPAKWGSTNSLGVDIDGDKSDDIGFGISDISFHYFCNFIVLNKSIDVSAYHFTSANDGIDTNSLNIYYDVKGFNLNDTIKNSTDWTTQKDTIYKMGIIKHRNYVNPKFILKNPYIGFRLFNNKDTLFGWMHVAITDTSIIVYDYAYQKR